MNTNEQLSQIISSAIERRILKKIVFSKARDKNIIKTVATLFTKGDGLFLQLESFQTDGKAIHRNIAVDKAPDECGAMAVGDYRQTDIITTAGNCVVMVSKSLSVHIKNGIRSSGESAEIKAHDGEKKHILDEPSAIPFLQFLGICGDDGRVFDRRRAKYRQINRFLEIVGDVYPSLPSEGTLSVCDLCCGKSYLTFAVYWYLTAIKGRKVKMYGVDLKADVISLCADGAKRLGYDGMVFLHQNALEFVPDEHLDMMISLHACDIATDIVLSGAVKYGVGVILSTPCCHHEMFSQISSPALGFITDYPILKQKLCDAATDALRAKRLELENYSVTAIELVDPDETPKNVLIRAIKRKKPLSKARLAELQAQYDEAIAMLGVTPKMNELLKSM